MRRPPHLSVFLQVVKVSRSTQTVRLVVPAVRQSEVPPPGVPVVCQSEAPPSGVPAANQEAERTPASWRCLPAEYYDILTPLQPRSSLIYLLSPVPPHSPAAGPAPPHTGPAPLHTGSAPRRCRKRRPQACQGSKVKYKPLPVRFYNPTSKRILKHPPPSRGPAPSCPPPPCVRQLFRSLSPDLNTEGEGPSRIKAPPPHSRGHRPRPLRKTRSQAAPPREGLPPPPSRRGRGRRGNCPSK